MDQPTVVDHDPAVRERLAELAFVQDRMMHVIGHALWTPASTVDGLAQALLAGGELTDDIRNALAHSAARLTRALDDVLVAAEVTTRFPVDRESEADLVGNLQVVWDQIAGGVQLVVHAVDRPSVAISPSALRRIALHLLDNAIRYGKDTIFVDVTQTATVAIATIVNDGLEVSSDDQRRAFEMFYRGQRAVMEEASGLGLGLSVARLLARRAGGDVTIAARQEGGATVTLALPLASPLAGPA